MVEFGTSADAFEYHWRLLDFVFALPDPRSFPHLTGALSAPDQALVDRYVATARDLAASGVINSADSGMTVNIEDDTDIEHVVVQMVERDRQAGFAALLRHCDSHNENARFGRVADILFAATKQDTSLSATERDDALDVLKLWRRAAGQLHAKSLQQKVRDKMVVEAGALILDFEEEHSPAQLLSAFDYGDLLHWDRGRELLDEWEGDEFRAGDRRLAFFAAACALAHVYMGFAALASTATSAAA